MRGTRADAWKELRKVQAAQDEGRYVDPSRITLDAFLDRWLETMKPTWRTATYDQAERLLSSYVRPEIGALPLQKIGPMAIQRMLNGMARTRRSKRREEPAPKPISAATKRHVARTLGQALRQAVRWRLLTWNPATEVRLPKAQRVQAKNSLTTPQLHALLAAASGTRLEALWHLLAATGCRSQEALGLTWKHVDLDGGASAWASRCWRARACTTNRTRPAACGTCRSPARPCKPCASWIWSSRTRRAGPST